MRKLNLRRHELPKRMLGNNMFKAVDPAYLLYYILFQLHIHSISRHEHRHDATSELDLKPETLQNREHFGVFDVLAQDRAHIVCAHQYTRRDSSLGININRDFEYLPARNVCDEYRDTLHGLARKIRIHADRESCGGIGLELDTLRGHANSRPIESRGFQDDITSRCGDLGGCSSFDTRDRERALAVCNHHHRFTQRIRYIIECVDFFTITRHTHNDFGTGYFFKIKRMQRLSRIQHDIVGSIHYIVD